MACSAEQPPNITMVVQQQPEEKETDLRLAMEFPRHNWLVKHLLKEKMLKDRDIHKNNDCSKPALPNISDSNAADKDDPIALTVIPEKEKALPLTTVSSTAVPFTKTTENTMKKDFSGAECFKGTILCNRQHEQGSESSKEKAVEPPAKVSCTEIPEENPRFYQINTNSKKSTPTATSFQNAPLDCSLKIKNVDRSKTLFSLDKTNNRPSAPLDLTMKCKHTRNEENALDLSANVVRNLSCVGPMEDNSVFSPQKQATPHPNKGEISAITSVTNNIEDIPICRASSPFASESGIGLCKKGNTSASSQTRSTAAGDNPPRIPTAFTTTEAQLNKTQLCCSTAYLHTNTTPSSTSSMLLQVNQQMQSKSLATNSLHTPEFSVVKPRISTAGHSQKPHLSSVPLPNSMTISTSSLSSGSDMSVMVSCTQTTRDGTRKQSTPSSPYSNPHSIDKQSSNNWQAAPEVLMHCKNNSNSSDAHNHAVANIMHKTNLPISKPAQHRNSGNNCVIDVDALYDDIPTITPRKKTKPHDQDLKSASSTTISTSKSYRSMTVPFSGSFSTNVQPSGNNTNFRLFAGETTQHAPTTRSKSLDSSQMFNPAAPIVSKPNSAPPATAVAQRFPNHFAPPVTSLEKDNAAVSNYLPAVQATMELRRPPLCSAVVSSQHINTPRMPKSFDEWRSPTPMIPGGMPRKMFSRVAPPAILPNQMLPGSRSSSFRMPVKPTPINYHHMVSQRQPRISPVRNFPSDLQSPYNIPPVLSFNPLQQSRQKATLPRPSVVRAPPGGISINSTPIRPQPHNEYNRIPHDATNLSGNHNSVPPFSSRVRLSSEEARNFAAQLKVEQRELEMKMNNLKELERSLIPAPHLHTQPQQVSLDPRSSTIPLANPSRYGNFIARNSAQRSLTSVPNLHSRKTGENFQCPIPPNSSYNAACRSQPLASLDERCGRCTQPAFFVCSGCRSVWYCSKECQVQDWNKHINHCH